MGKFGYYVIDADGHGGDLPNWWERLPAQWKPKWDERRARIKQHFANLPADLSEAAQIDGVKPTQFLFRILIPLSWNAIGALAVIQFVYGWNMYLWPLLLQPDDQVVQVGLASLRNADLGQIYGPLMLGALLAMRGRTP